MDLVSPWHWDCAECGGPIARLCGKGPCQEIHGFDRAGKPVRCGLDFWLPKGTLAKLGRELHEWNGGWVHTDPSGRCTCGHPMHGEDCDECRTEVGRFLAGWHPAIPYDQIEKDHEPVYRAELVGV